MHAKNVHGDGPTDAGKITDWDFEVVEQSYCEKKSG